MFKHRQERRRVLPLQHRLSQLLQYALAIVIKVILPSVDVERRKRNRARQGPAASI